MNEYADTARMKCPNCLGAGGFGFNNRCGYCTGGTIHLSGDDARFYNRYQAETAEGREDAWHRWVRRTRDA
jgi:hypothetical protein